MLSVSILYKKALRLFVELSYWLSTLNGSQGRQVKLLFVKMKDRVLG